MACVRACNMVHAGMQRGGVWGGVEPATSILALFLAWHDGPPTRMNPHAALVHQSASCHTVSENFATSAALQSKSLPRWTGYNGWQNSELWAACKPIQMR